MRKGENIRKRKDGRFEARYFDDNKNKIISVYAHSYREVKEKKKRAISNNEKPVKQINSSLKDCFIIFLNDIKLSVKKSTYAKYHDNIYKHILPYFGDVKINNITQETIDNFIDYKQVNGRLDKKGGLSVKAINDILVPFKLCLKKYGLPYEYKLPKQKQNNQIKFLTESEFDKIKTYCMLDITLFKLGILLTLYTGVRIGELCALKWADIDLDNGLLNIDKTIQRIKNTDTTTDKKTIIIIDKPKSTNSTRTIPIPIFLLKILKNFKTSESCYLLTGTRGYIEPRLCQDKFKAIIKIINIGDINFHALRHTFATRWLEKGGDIKSLSEILGHSDVAFTMNRYVHSTLNQKRKEMEKVAT